MSGRFSVEAVFKAVDRVTAPVTRMQSRVNKFTAASAAGFRRLDRSVSSFNRNMRQSASTVALGAAVMGGALGKVVSVGANFEQSLTNASARFPGEVLKGTKAFAELEAEARRVGKTTEFTSGQAAEGLNFLALAGFDAKAAIAAMPGVVNLATAAQIDLGRATDIATDSLGAFNLLSKDATQQQANLTRVTDVMAKASTSANLSIEQMFEAIKDGAPVGTAAGQSLETVAAMAGIIANAGIKGTRAGTALKNIFLQLNAPGSEASKTLRRIGVDTEDSNGKIRDTVAVMEDLRDALSTKTETEGIRIINRLFGKIPIAAAINLIKQVDNVRAFRTELEKAAGATETMADVIRDTTRIRWKAFWSAVEGTAISAFRNAQKPIDEAIIAGTKWVRLNESSIADKLGRGMAYFAKNFESIMQNTFSFLKFVAGWVVFSAVLKTVVLAMTALNLLMAAPLAATALGLAAVGVAVFTLVTNLEAVRDSFRAWPTALRPVAVLFEKLLDVAIMLRDLAGKLPSFIADKAFNFFGGDDVAEEARSETDTYHARRNQIISKSLDTTINRSEVTIRTPDGAIADVTKGHLGPSLKLAPSGGMQ